MDNKSYYRKFIIEAVCKIDNITDLEMMYGMARASLEDIKDNASKQSKATVIVEMLEEIESQDMLINIYSFILGMLSTN